MTSTRERGGTLPAELTSFVGRREEISQIKELLGGNRLVTLTGVGGVGKTRLALRVARDLRRAFADGVFLVELSALEDPVLLPYTVIDVLRIGEQSSRSPMAVLTEHLRHRHALLVLDNCEHLLDAAAALADALLRAGSQLRVLATSRQPLGITGEQLVPVPTLPVPDQDAPLVAGIASQYPGLALFANRAAAVVPDFRVTADNEDAVVRLCRRLEGIPLAIELAAARLRVLPVADLADRVEDRFALLTHGARTAPGRHQTLQAAIDYSHALCSEGERVLWHRASVFADSFTLAAAEAVCSDEALPRAAILDTVDGLVEKSIVARQDDEGEARFGMLETLRDYGQERLREAGEQDRIRRRHRDWYLRLVERAAVEWFGPSQEAWAFRLRAEHANLRTALEYSLSAPGEAGAALRMAGLPWFLWLACGYMTEGRLWLERGLALDTKPSQDRAWALGTAAYIAVLQGDAAGASSFLEECVGLGQGLQDNAVLAYATSVRGLKEFLGADPNAAMPLFEDAQRRYAALNLPEDYLTTVLVDMALALVLRQEPDRAIELFTEVLARCQQAGERWCLSTALMGLGFAMLIRGDLEEAEAHARESLRLKWAFHDTLGLAHSLDLLAWTKVANKDAAAGAALLGGASGLWRVLGAQLSGFQGLISQRRHFEDLARTAVGDAAFDRAFAHGAEQPLDELLAEALDEQPTRTPASHATPGPSPLTPREREVADLVAAGLANKDIAAALVISRRTAEAHVQNILTKLGFTSRSQVMSWVFDQRASG